jgi:hypothetical protein
MRIVLLRGQAPGAAQERRPRRFRQGGLPVQDMPGSRAGQTLSQNPQTAATGVESRNPMTSLNKFGKAWLARFLLEGVRERPSLACST